MLKSIDVLIGLTVIMLALSMAVTVITQAVTAIANSRGLHLRRGLTDLLQQLDPGLNAELSKAIATKVLTHPLVSGSGGPMALVRRLGSVVHREEFTKLLMALATGPGSDDLEPAAKAALKTALKNNGVGNPEDTLKNIRTFALQLERSHPDLSHMARQNIAVLQEAGSDLVAKINGWFDQTMDRTSQRFTASTRLITFAGALIVAVGLQVDTPNLVNRLAADDKLRDAFVQEAIAAQQKAGEDQTAAAGTSAPSADHKIAQEYYSFMAANGIIRLPSESSFDAWLADLEQANPLGLLVTALLLSLGAPFWYSALSQLLQLRSVLATKDDAQRTRRQGTDRTQAGSPAPPAPRMPGVAGERGDMLAVG